MKSGVLRPPESFELEVSLAVCVSLCLHVHFKIFFSVCENDTGILVGEYIKFEDFYGNKAILMIFILLICKDGSSSIF